MPKEYFQVKETATLDSLNLGDRIHIIGICGVAMAPLAVLLKERGFAVSGSDKEFYEPMASVLTRSGIKTFQGYDAVNIASDVKLVVIGNSVSYGNPEVVAVEERKLPYTFFSKLLYETVIVGNNSVVITGTHGKSTTTAICATALEKAGLNPGYFVGAEVKELPLSLRAGKTAGVSVVEGDEYDSAFFAKVPKFNFYKPNILVITSIEFDHADIYRDLDHVVEQFTNLVSTLGSKDTVICCVDYPVIKNKIVEWKKSTKAKFITYGVSNEADVKVCLGEKQPLPGLHNAQNITAVKIILKLLGVEESDLIDSFKGLRRRQEVLVDNDKLILIEDFAHHPTAVRETIAAIKAKYPNRRLLAVFEPRSNTSRRKVFFNEYLKAFNKAEKVILAEVKVRDIDKGQELLDVNELARAINSSGVSCVALAQEEIFNYITQSIASGDVILVMSNGSFAGLSAKLAAANAYL